LRRPTSGREVARRPSSESSAAMTAQKYRQLTDQRPLINPWSQNPAGGKVSAAIRHHCCHHCVIQDGYNAWPGQSAAILLLSCLDRLPPSSDRRTHSCSVNSNFI
jgi:hypothetical protein